MATRKTGGGSKARAKASSTKSRKATPRKASTKGRTKPAAARPPKPAARTRKPPARTRKPAASPPEAPPEAPASIPPASLPPTLAADQGLSLRQAAALLGPPDADLEASVFGCYPAQQLQDEGAKISSDAIVEDGERLCAAAVPLLLCQDGELQQAAAKAGLTRPLVTLLVHALLRLDGAWTQASSGAYDSRQATAARLDAAVAEGRRLRREIRERLSTVAQADQAARHRLDHGVSHPTTASSLAEQLDDLALVVDAVLLHPDEKVRSLVLLRGVSEDDADALRKAANQLREAAEDHSTDEQARAARRQARLDILDGYCLVLIGEVLAALRSMSRRTRAVRRPSLQRLRAYFQARLPDEADEADA